MIHGGDLASATAAYGAPADGWLDLSTGISPFAYPDLTCTHEAWTRLPQAGSEAALLAAARKLYRAPNGAGICAAPGTQALIQRVPHLVAKGAVSIVGPTYCEHSTAWRAAGHDVRNVHHVDETSGAASVVAVNPNNPDGRTWSCDDLRLIQARCVERGGLLVVDEAFADVDDAMSLAPDAAAGEGLVVLRSFGKFFGLAGLRLGFAIAAPDLARRLADDLGPWAVPGPALEIGARALSDTHWIDGARAQVRAAATTLEATLRAAGLNVIANVGLFVTISDDRATHLHAGLARRGVWCRRFDYAPDWLRFGLPSATDQVRFANALEGALRDAAG
ncbi:MAG: threonine-phosphate decarboxylase CobD [Pseudomonadota bacterium]